MKVLIEKSSRRLTLMEDGGAVILSCRAAFGRAEGPKRRSGDLRTPEGDYFVCLIKEKGKYGPSLGLNYPSLRDAQEGAREGLIGENLLPLFHEAEARRTRPPWGTALGGEIYIHAGGSAENWTAGCIALEPEDMDALFARCVLGTPVTIIP